MSFAEELYKDKQKPKSHLYEEMFVQNLFQHDMYAGGSNGLVENVKKMMENNKEARCFIAGVDFNSNEECIYKQLNPKSSIGFTDDLDWNVVKELLEGEIMDPSNDLGLKTLKVSIVEKMGEHTYQTFWGSNPKFEKKMELEHHIWIEASW